MAPLLTYFLQAAGAEMTVRAMGTLGALGERVVEYGVVVCRNGDSGGNILVIPSFFPLPGPSHVSSLWALNIRILEKHQLEPRLYHLRIQVPLIKFLKILRKFYAPGRLLSTSVSLESASRHLRRLSTALNCTRRSLHSDTRYQDRGPKPPASSFSCRSQVIGERNFPSAAVIRTPICSFWISVVVYPIRYDNTATRYSTGY